VALRNANGVSSFTLWGEIRTALGAVLNIVTSTESY